MSNYERGYEELDQEEKTKLVSASLGLIRVVTEVWGSEKGMALWDTMASTISTDLKGDLFFGMITGKYSFNGVTFKNPDPTAMSNHFVSMIKAVRTATGWGLKDAKDFCDTVRAGETRTIEVSGREREILISTMRDLGITVY